MNNQKLKLYSHYVMNAPGSSENLFCIAKDQVQRRKLRPSATKIVVTYIKTSNILVQVTPS